MPDSLNRHNTPDARLPEHLQGASIEELRELTVESIFDHMFMDHSFARSVAERYVESMDDNEIYYWHEEV